MTESGQSSQNAASWLRTAPAIACGGALCVLVLVLLPGVLGYPGDDPGDFVDETPAIEAAEEANEVLRERIELLKRVLDEGVCVADGQLTTPNGPLSPELSGALPGPPPSLRQPSQTAVAHLSNFSGPVSDLLENVSVVVRVGMPDGSGGSGSGTFVGPDLVVTNAHVVEGADPSQVLVFNKSIGVLQAEVVAEGVPMDTNSAGTRQPDIALLRVKGVPADHPYLALADAKSGGTVVASTFPGVYLDKNIAISQWLSNPSSSPGQIGPLFDVQIANGVVSEKDGVDYVWHTALADKGSSGGTLADECGRLIGVHVGSIAREQAEDEKLAGRQPPPFPRAIASSSVRAFASDQGITSLVYDQSECN